MVAGPRNCSLTALVVDGDTTSNMIEQGLLRSFGVITCGVDNGRAAIDLFASGAKFDLILIDLILPVINGLETTRQIRAMGVKTKMLGVTACSREREEKAFLAAGVDEFIEKPLDSNRLASILMELNAN
ncbi:hypothetical protein SLEP1_g718 [Rubroshorea leprosula]|uniref:Response regulatory domain-containing protein n=1 Tax=Rubroshorea leprosula TaxID=152421 RepID=A0AAV5HG75_9ROSI|nr:hypothetical protein SLEP1_g718 [Rubroshorea leprosula]